MFGGGESAWSTNSSSGSEVTRRLHHSSLRRSSSPWSALSWTRAAPAQKCGNDGGDHDITYHNHNENLGVDTKEIRVVSVHDFRQGRAHRAVFGVCHKISQKVILGEL